MIRAFIAVEIEPTAELAPVVQACARMGQAVRPVAAGSLHATLRFLGNVDESTVRSLTEAVREAVGAARAFEARLRGLGAFPDARRPSVVWVGLDDGGALTAIAQRLDAALVPRGFGPPERPFTPHLTIARVKARPPGQLLELIRGNPQTAYGARPVDAVHLIQSELGRDGPKYTRLGTQNLAME